MESDKESIAVAAARLVVDEGMEFGPAKLRARKLLQLPARAPLPDNEQLELAVQEHIRLFCADTQPAELQALRALAVVWLGRLAAFRPYLTGAVWRGIATRHSDIYLDLFCDDPKAAEIELLNQGARYDVASAPGFQGRSVDDLQLQVMCQALQAPVRIHLLIHDFDDLRGALRPDAQGRRLRGDATAVREMLHDGAYGNA